MATIHLLERSNAAAAGRTVLMANPFARGVEGARVAEAARLLGLDDRAVRVVGRDGSARSLAEESVRHRVAQLFVAGGDGTVHQAVQAAVGTRTALGIVPLGTANDLAGAIGVPPGLNGARALALGTATAEVDVVRFDGHCVATVGGFGVPACVADRYNRLRALPGVGRAVSLLGRAVYQAIAVDRILSEGAAPETYRVRFDRSPETRIRASAVLIGLVERFGGGLQWTEGGAVRPGTFSALFITTTSRVGLLRALVRLKSGRSLYGIARAYSGLTRLSLRSTRPVHGFGDGETLGLRSHTMVELEPRALRVLVPRRSITPVHAAPSAALREAV